MNRRTAIAWIAALFAPAAIKAADTIPVKPAAFVPTRPAEWPSVAARTMRWACVCLRHGAHWTIGAINFAMATIGQVRHHLVSVHGHNYAELNGMSKEQMGNLHDAHHEGRSYGRYNFPATPPNGVDKLRRRPT